MSVRSRENMRHLKASGKLVCGFFIFPVRFGRNETQIYHIYQISSSISNSSDKNNNINSNNNRNNGNRRRTSGRRRIFV